MMSCILNHTHGIGDSVRRAASGSIGSEKDQNTGEVITTASASRKITNTNGQLAAVPANYTTSVK